MKKYMMVLSVFASCMLLATLSRSQTTNPLPELVINPPSGNLTLGGIPQLIADKLKEAKPCGLVDLAGHIGGGGYLPIYTFHDANGTSYIEAANIGYRAIQGQKPSVLLMPLAIDVTSISGRLWNFQWARVHLTRSKFPDFFLGPTALVPLDSAQVKALRLKQAKDFIAIVGSVRF